MARTDIGFGIRGERRVERDAGRTPTGDAKVRAAASSRHRYGLVAPVAALHEGRQLDAVASPVPAG